MNRRTTAPPSGERAFVHAMSVPLLGGVRGGFMVPTRDSGIIEAAHDNDRHRE